MLVLMEYVIRQKKKIYYNYIDSSSKKAYNSYSRYDGQWFSKDIALVNLMQKNPEDSWLQKTGKNIKRCQVLFFCLLGVLIIIGVLSKIYGWM
ncbi:hypothetical protein [Flavobacterium sp. AG291]|uniref:hypothetical protein n=1 Tax=Flavobacterium sp. AG291 TaxID=2184000 RepID=UPI000E0B6A0A|nr:hypothetical protein [Flavobacterium sp. AG291]